MNDNFRQMFLNLGIRLILPEGFVLEGERMLRVGNHLFFFCFFQSSSFIKALNGLIHSTAYDLRGCFVHAD